MPVTAPLPGRGEIRLRQTAIGVNFIDVYCRTGYFKLLTPPGVLGMEAVGTVVDVGPDVSHLRSGQRVGYACPPAGSYATVRTMDAALVVPLPEWLDDETAAAGLLKGITAEFLLHRVHAVQPGETVLVFAPAGGVGRMLCQWANRLGATVIGATSTPEKARIAQANGARHVILPGKKSLEDQVRDLTGGKGADVIYDAVGRDTFDHSVAALSTCGHLVSFGQASGDIGPRDIGALASRSATLSRPNYGDYTDTPDKVKASTDRLFDAIRRGIITVEIGQRFKLSDAASAHRALESRETTASTVLIPDEQWRDTV
ncbi:quinone oxidoreductase [Rhodospirillaceae bacterium KN72]|uniref:Quinone oxidoreductase n=2 Tax=Pacificispira spongiicola TaxID=2729598 RepID=A0A7Y0DY06_9PROT|nr:quinone oxidoreductase [Pacificispira spongiicola]